MKKEYENYYKNLGLNIAFYRKRAKLTQIMLAEFAEVDRSHISAVELGNTGISLDVLFKICEVLRIEPKDLFDFRD